MPTTIWTLPVPSTALENGGPKLETRPRRVVAILFAYESEDGGRQHESAIVFEGVEAYKVTYYDARDPSTLEAYDRLVDRGPTPWLSELSANLKRTGARADGLAHLMINFDDGPCYEVVCRSHRLETDEAARQDDR